MQSPSFHCLCHMHGKAVDNVTLAWLLNYCSSHGNGTNTVDYCNLYAECLAENGSIKLLYNALMCVIIGGTMHMRNAGSLCPIDSGLICDNTKMVILIVDTEGPLSATIPKLVNNKWGKLIWNRLEFGNFSTHYCSQSNKCGNQPTIAKIFPSEFKIQNLLGKYFLIKIQKGIKVWKQFKSERLECVDGNLPQLELERS